MRGSWKVVGDDLIECKVVAVDAKTGSLDGLSDSEKTGTYRFAVTPDTLTLEHASGSPWVTGMQNFTVELTPQK